MAVNAASSYDTYLNLETARVDGGWVYFQINGDSYMQLQGGTLDVGLGGFSGILRCWKISKMFNISTYYNLQFIKKYNNSGNLDVDLGGFSDIN